MGFAVSRRGVLVGGAAAALRLPELKARPLRVAHLTDCHIQPELKAAEGTAKAMRHAMSQRPKPDLVLMGGDHVMDANAQNETRTKLQWDLFDRVRKENIDVPTHFALGNHDPWGWNKKASGTDGSEPLWGKRWFTEHFG